MEFEKEWLTNKEKLIQYCHYAYKNHDDNFFKFYGELQLEAIKTNNIIALEILWSAIYNHDRDTPCYEHWLFEAIKYGNLKTFEHCLYAYMNYNCIHDRGEKYWTDYQEYLDKCGDPQVLELLKKFEPVIINGKLPNNYSESPDPSEIEIDEYFTEQRINKHKLYLQIIEKHNKES